ncbi:hypothetical protein PVK06_030302 [Gossypium arboreum]|uniref:Secreted protein n=1 Tax=Gossypium arboreum TaxID=29729 RepID=A0ABR0NR16_GOSAR|nr:hypothetical protein PVK06_030302 [Gossypium arboreum]
MAWPKTHMLVWPTRLIWRSPCGLYGHTHITTWPCLVHDNAFIDHTVVSRTRPPTRPAIYQCGVDSRKFQLLSKHHFS